MVSAATAVAIADGTTEGSCGILFLAIFIIGGQFAGFDNDDLWLQSRLIPHFEVVADWIKVMAPQGYELLVPDEPADSLPVEVPDVVINPET